MATPDIEIVEVSLLSGRSDRPSMAFTPGTPSPTVSLGSAGQWAISGEGVGPVHVFVTFDGQSVHVAAAVANLPVAMAGLPVGAGWTKAPIPCELRFGGACVILRRTSRPGAFTQEEATVHDGGAPWQQAARAGQVHAANPAMGAQIPSVRPAAGMPAEATHAMMPLPQQTTSSHPPAPIDLSATTPMADAQKYRDAVAAAQAAAARPPLESSPTTVRQPPTGMMPPTPPAPEPLGELEKTVIAPHPPRPPQAMLDVTPQVVAPPTYAMPTAPVAPPPAQEKEEKPPNFWQAASPVKKATLVLMPFALIMAFLMLHDEPARPPKVVAQKHAARDAGALATITSSDGGAASIAATADASTASTTASVDATNTADAGAEPNAPPDTTAKDGKTDTRDQGGTGKPTPALASKRTPERLALDKVSAGSFDDAAKQYDALAAAHPDDPSYKEAARILHEKAGN